MIIGTVSILAYTLFGGMWSVAVTDFLQMIILVAGLFILAVFAGHRPAAPTKVDGAGGEQGHVPASGPSRASRTWLFFFAPPSP